MSKPGAASFSVGMPNYPAVYATRAALEYVRDVGVPAIDRAARPLVLACLEELKRLPVELLTPPDPEHLAGMRRRPLRGHFPRCVESQLSRPGFPSGSRQFGLCRHTKSSARKRVRALYCCEEVF